MVAKRTQMKVLCFSDTSSTSVCIMSAHYSSRFPEKKKEKKIVGWEDLPAVTDRVKKYYKVFLGFATCKPPQSCLSHRYTHTHTHGEEHICMDKSDISSKSSTLKHCRGKVVLQTRWVYLKNTTPCDSYLYSGQIIYIDSIS